MKEWCGAPSCYLEVGPPQKMMMTKKMNTALTMKTTSTMKTTPMLQCKVITYYLNRLLMTLHLDRHSTTDPKL